MIRTTPRANRENLVRKAGWAAVVAAAALLTIEVALSFERPVLSFPAYFTAGHLVVEGKRIANFYNDDWFGKEVARFEPTLREIYNANAPTTAIFYAPLALFETPFGARLAWTVISIPLLVLFVEALIGISGASSAARPYWYVAVLIAQPIEDNFRHGQAYLVIGLGLVLCLRWWRPGRQARAGSMLGALYAYKTAGLMLWPLAVVTGRWRIVLWGLGVIAAIAALTWPLVGSDGWLAYFAYAHQLANSPNHRVTALQTVQSLIEHLLHDGETPGRPIIELSFAVAHGIAMGAILLMLATTMYAAHRRPDDDLGVGAAILLTLVALPETLLHAYTLAFIPIAQLARRIGPLSASTADVGPSDVNWRRIALWLGAAIIVIRVPFLSAHFLDGWAALLAYPKLYGALIVWSLCMLHLLRGEDREDFAIAKQTPP